MTTLKVGKVKKASLQEVVVIAKSLADEVPRFGAFVVMPGLTADQRTFGVIENIEITASGLAERLMDLGDLPEEVVLDQSQGGQGTVEILVKVAPIAYEDGETFRIGTPPQPPIALQEIVVCASRDVQRISHTCEFVTSLLRRGADITLAAVREAMLSYPLRQREPFLMLACLKVQTEWMTQNGRACMALVQRIADLRSQ